MEIPEHIDALRRHGDLLADAAERAGLDAPVPPCPAWQVKDLLRHTGYVHRWAARHITECPQAMLEGLPEEEILRGGAADPELLAWFRAGCASLAEILTEADPDLVCATFMDAPTPLAFWARREAHETAIHRAERRSSPSGETGPRYPPDFAAERRRRADHGVQPAPQVPAIGREWRQPAGTGHRHRPLLARGQRGRPRPGPARRLRPAPAPGMLRSADACLRPVPVPLEPERRRPRPTSRSPATRASSGAWLSSVRVSWD